MLSLIHALRVNIDRICNYHKIHNHRIYSHNIYNVMRVVHLHSSRSQPYSSKYVISIQDVTYKKAKKNCFTRVYLGHVLLVCGLLRARGSCCTYIALDRFKK